MAGDPRRLVWVWAAVAAGVAAFAPAAAHGAADQPNWKYFKNIPPLDGSDDDRRVIGCYPAADGSAAAFPCTVNERNTPADATHPWDVPLPPASAMPTTTTSGPFADAALSALSPLAPGPARTVRPTAATRDYFYPWTDQWRNSGCNPANFSGVTPGSPGGTDANDVNAAIVNVFVAHNHMHDWAKGLGFTPATFNMEADDPMLGDVQAGARSGAPTFSGRDADNQATPADGTSPAVTTYLWQPIAGAYYPRCVDGSFDMSLLAHEYAHAIANRMVGGASTGLSSSSDGQALAIGEGFADSAAVAYLLDHVYAPADDEDRFAIGAYITGDKAHGVRNYSMADSPLNYSNVQGWDGSGASSPADDGEIWAAVNHDVRAALVTADPADGNHRWMEIAFDALLTMPANATMIDARNAYIDAADTADEETLLWTAFARRGLGSGASSTDTDDPNPEPSFESPARIDESTITFAPSVEAELYVGDYEAGVTPVADTDPSTALDATVEMLPGQYSFLARADGRGAQRFERDIPASSDVRLEVQLPVNRASAANGATATGDGARLGDLIDDTEATNWERTGAGPGGAQVTVDLAGGPQVVERVNVSAMLQGTDDGEEADDGDNQNRFTALRQFELYACSEACSASANFTKFYTSPADAFPGAAPRPTTPDLNLRSFDVPDTAATHLRLVVASNQCTGSSVFAAESETDPSSSSDCRAGNAGGVGRMDRAVRIAELQVFSRDPDPAGGGSGTTTLTGPGLFPDPRPVLTRLSLSNRRFRRGSALPRAAAAPRGTVIRFRLSEAARVTYTFRRRAGRRYVRAGTLKRAAKAGRNRLRFYGRLSRRRALRPGVYRMVVAATDSAGQRSARKTASFTLLAR